MKNYTVRRYTSEDYALWNDFISHAKNATFLFHRDFMEYHADRFQDFSLLVFEDEKLVALLPANKVDEIVYSHQGLTYGGFVTENTIDADQFGYIISALVKFLKANDKKQIIIKEIISFYNKSNVTDFESCFIKNGAKITEQKMNLAVNYKSDFVISKSKRKHFRRLQSEGLKIQREDVFEDFWKQVLTPLLNSKYDTNPVHSLAEITFLKSKFPLNIEQYNLYLDGEILSGITLFKSNTIVKSQYGATTEKGKKFRALDFLFIYLIEEFSKTFDYFDMGTVNDNSELGYNEGLLNQKKELGCDLYYQNIYQIEL